MNQYEKFLQLHHGDEPLLIGNVWDVTSAKAFERNGFSAIATSSSAVARTMGYEDGENIPFSLLLQVVERVISSVSIPVSVDIEKGYSTSIEGIIENIEKLYDLGAVGFNLEDSSRDDKTQLQPADAFQKIISSIKDHFEKKNINMFINARTDAYVVKLPSPLAESVDRIKIYESAGATGIFVPFISDKDEIKQVVEATKLPVNVLCMPSLPRFEELRGLGVKRISMGGAVQMFAAKAIERITKAIKEDGSFRSLFA